MTPEERVDLERELLECLRRAEEKPKLSSWIPIYLAIFTLMIGAANLYTNIMTRIALLEDHIQAIEEVMKDDQF